MPARKVIPNVQKDGVPSDYSAPTRRTTRRPTKKAAVQQQVGIPVDADEKYAATTWGNTSAATEVLEDIRVPSGQLCLARRPGVEGLIKAGVLNDLDSLTAIVNEKHIKRAKGQKQINVQALGADPKALANVLHLADRILCYIVVKPEIVMTPNDPTRREPGVIYADMVDIDDKMFLLNYAVGGTRDLERFRRELDESVRDVGIIKDPTGKTE